MEILHEDDTHNRRQAERGNRGLCSLLLLFSCVRWYTIRMFESPAAPDVGTTLADKVLEVIVSFIQYPLDVLATGSNFYILGYFMIGCMALGLVTWIVRKATLGKAGITDFDVLASRASNIGFHYDGLQPFHFSHTHSDASGLDKPGRLGEDDMPLSSFGKTGGETVQSTGFGLNTWQKTQYTKAKKAGYSDDDAFMFAREFDSAKSERAYSHKDDRYKGLSKF